MATVTTRRSVRNPVFDVLSKHFEKLQQEHGGGGSPLSDHHEVLGILKKMASSAGNQEWLVQHALDWSGSVVEPLKHFLTVVEDTVSAHPVLAGFVWGSIRFVLTVMSAHSKHFEAATGVLKDICSRLAFYRDVDPAVYRNSPAVQQALARVLGTILDLCHEICSVFQHRGNLMLFMMKNPWKGAELRKTIYEFQKAESGLRRQIKHEQRNHGSRSLSDSPTHSRFCAEEDRRYIIESQQQGDYLDKVQEFHALLDMIPHANTLFVQKHPLDRDLILEEWILNTKEYSDWSSIMSLASRTSERILYIHGDREPDDTITYAIADDLVHQHRKYRTSHNITVSLQRCDARTTPHIILGSVLRDILTHLPVHMQHHHRDLACSSLAEVEHSIRLVVPHFDKVYIILEGVMEMAPMDVDRMVLCVKKLAGARSVYVAVVDRTTERLERALRSSPSVNLALGSDVPPTMRKMSPAGSVFFEYQSPRSSVHSHSVVSRKQPGSTLARAF